MRTERRGSPALVAALLSSLAFAAAGASAQAGPPLHPDFDTRYSIPAGTDLKTLVGKPALIDMRVESFKDPSSGESRLGGAGDAHVVVPAPFATIDRLLSDIEGQTRIFPRLKRSVVLSRNGNALVAEQEVGISFLGLFFGSRMRQEIVRDELPGGAVGWRGRLLESLDQGMYRSSGSWYYLPVQIAGREMTYFRLYSSPGVRKPFPGMAGLVKTFTPPELIDMLRGLQKAAAAAAALEGATLAAR